MFQVAAWLALATLLFLYGLISWLHQRLLSRHGLPKDIPWACGDTGAMGVASMHLRSLFSLKSIIVDAYEKYSKNGQVFILPNVATGPEVILPMSHMKWLLEQPDAVLDQNEVNREFLHADRTMLHENIVKDMVHGRVIRREMTKDLDTYAHSVVDEIEHALSNSWGHDAYWREVRLYDSLLDIIARASNRVLVGEPLCRDIDHLRSSSTYARNVVLTAGILNILSPWLQRICAPAIMAYDMWHYRKIASKVQPLITQRAMHMKATSEPTETIQTPHNDYVQWALRDAYSRDVLLEREPEMITKRLTVLSFAAIQSSVITATNCIFDIAASPKAYHIQDALREEANQVIAANPQLWFQRRFLNTMIKLDSTFRESMRLWGFISRGVMKKVVAQNGIVLPTGQHIPYGSKAMEFLPFRFCSGEDTAEGKGNPSISMVTSGDNFMAFSHGRHACPGRFFAANQLKLLLAIIVRRYDIEHIATRPENKWLNNTVGPPIWDTVRIRRRQ